MIDDCRPMNKSLPEMVRSYLDNYGEIGFTKRDLNEACYAISLKDKNHISSILNNLLKSKKIQRRGRGEYVAVNTNMQLVNWEEEEGVCDEYPMYLPFGLNDLVSIAPRNVIVLEGATNAGKTAICMNVLHGSITKSTNKAMYIFSEGGPQEIKRRITLAGMDFSAWKDGRIIASARTSTQHQIIEAHNPDGLTVVDFITPPQQDYFRLGFAIDEVHESLGHGVAFCCVQKRSDQAIGRGGEAIREKPRLSMTLDLLSKEKSYILASLRVVKCKTPKDLMNNPDGMSVDFAVSHGCRLHQLTEWAYVKDADRKKDSYISKLKYRMDEKMCRSGNAW